MFVPLLSEERIERKSVELLSKFGRECGRAITPPVHVEDIAEKFLKLHLDFDDMHRRFPVPWLNCHRKGDILGALDFEESGIFVDQSLDPDDNPSKEWSFRFVVAHELGHYCLHSSLVKEQRRASMFAPVAFLFRNSLESDPLEWQANVFAWSLLMPRMLVVGMWEEKFGDQEPRVGDRSRRAHIAKLADVEDCERQLAIEEWENDCQLEDIARPLAERFLVPPNAMRVRLEDLGLLRRGAHPVRQLTNAKQSYFFETIVRC